MRNPVLLVLSPMLMTIWVTGCETAPKTPPPADVAAAQQTPTAMTEPVVADVSRPRPSAATVERSPKRSSKPRAAEPDNAGYKLAKPIYLMTSEERVAWANAEFKRRDINVYASDQ